MNLIKKIAVVFLLLAIVIPLATTLSQEPVEQVWLDRFNGEDNGVVEDDRATAIGLDSSGNVYVAGFTFQQVQSNLYSPRFVTLKFQPDGTREWVEFWRPGSNATAAAGATVLGVDGQNNIVVGGFASGSADWGVAKYDPTGQMLWTSIYMASSSFLTEPDDLFIDAAGNSYLTGDVGSFINPDFGAVVKIDSAGNQEWVAEYYGPQFDGASGNAVVADNQGNVYLAGSAVVSGFSGQAAIVKFDPEGDLVWQRTDGSLFQSAFDEFRDIAIDHDGNLVVAGTYGFNTSEGSDIAISKYSPDGSLIWSEQFDGGNGSDSSAALAIDQQNNIVIAGSIRIDSGNVDTIILKFDPAGSLLWSASQGGDGLGSDFPRDLKLDNDNNIYYAGVEEPFTGVDFAVTAKLDPDGNPVWKQLYGGPEQGGSSAQAIAVDPEQKVFTAGTSSSSGDGFDIVTIHYQQQDVFVLGDVNRDGMANLLDVAPFVDLLTGGEYQLEADCNADGVVNLLDVAVLVEILTE